MKLVIGNRGTRNAVKVLAVGRHQKCTFGVFVASDGFADKREIVKGAGRCDSMCFRACVFGLDGSIPPDWMKILRISGKSQRRVLFLLQ